MSLVRTSVVSGFRKECSTGLGTVSAASATDVSDCLEVCSARWVSVAHRHSLRPRHNTEGCNGAAIHFDVHRGRGAPTGHFPITSNRQLGAGTTSSAREKESMTARHPLATLAIRRSLG